ncbi:MAG TPA: hypothetical protein VFN33_04780 [Gaiellaceae bacterium]|nr:hypothetical protein [Gaiellaceae bacterium]
MTDIPFPPLRDLPPGHLEARKRHLLDEIAEENGWLHLSLPAVRRRSWLAVAVVAAALVGAVGVGIAAGLGAFDGIGAAQHQQSAGDALDPATAAYVKRSLVGIQLDTARHIGRLPDGHDVYVITGSLNDLCVVVGPPNAESWCGQPLTDAHPATLATYPISNAAGTAVISWITFGVALDGVTSVSFQPTQAAAGGPSGPELTVPVTDNLWTYRTDDKVPPYALQSVAAHFADGRTVVEPPTGENCAAC